MKYKHLFFDLDHTLWDFDANARASLMQLHVDLNLPEKGIHDFDAFYRNYLVHNENLWAKYRAGQIKQDELRLKRMWLALLDFKIADEALAKQMNELFLQLLPTRTLLFPDTKEVLQYLREKSYGLHIITNGFDEVQHSKLKSSGLDEFFKVVVTSEGSNSLKPQKEIFEYALNKTGARVEESLMIGDAVDVDVLGALGVGMDAVHVNYHHAEQEVEPTYTVYHLKELKDFL
ncbi:YjjG family noncanonical pyrimidine nucleotidase [Flavisolibacter ginsenosidimutans]|uniref:Noncanonical pyrimidine nucleotidase, YjjG family n=1 Tax=Flavisolibacter ginsenosidimutans TaxID=661481 RepID=A0A5B8UN77_9BACT|nr:YjjG family noncanonical pyrimidine nucleotidase [Flavisolibacter ginsenosidimutans]QEC57669.1 noncanonical pyrimidine nucleotidase, YjjG family [Flavisolibacter ginsenosidimutans]